MLAAARANQLETATALMNNSANINAQNRHQKTALMYACEHGNRQLTQMLLSRGAKADLTDADGRTARGYAASGGHDSCVAALPVDAPLGFAAAGFTAAAAPAPAAASTARSTAAAPQDVLDGSAAGGDDRQTAAAAAQLTDGAGRGSVGGYSQLKDQIEELTAQLRKERDARRAADEEVAALRSQLAVFATPVAGVEDGGGGGNEGALRAQIAQLTLTNKDLAAKVEQLLDLEGEPALRQAAESRVTSLSTELARLRVRLTDAEDAAASKPRDVDVVPTAVLTQIQQDNARKVATLERRLAHATGGVSWWRRSERRG